MDCPIPPRLELELLPKGKELVLKYVTGLASASKFETDSNGREMVPWVRDGRGPSYPPYQVEEPFAGNYYPVNMLIALDDGKTELAVSTDVTQGGSSMEDGSLELMVHRRLQKDDARRDDVRLPRQRRQARGGGARADERLQVRGADDARQAPAGLWAHRVRAESPPS